jgi:nucleoside-diphosphate-sugar epimerase
MIVVTGGTGFLGLAVVREFLARGLPVRAVGRDPERCELLASLGAAVACGDLRDGKLVADACRDARAVVHAGALSAPFGARAEFFSTNVEGTGNVVAACRRHGVRRLIHISSPAVVFDGSDQLDAREDVPYPQRYSSNYAWSKRLAEECVRAAGLDAVILRPKAIFGPGDTALLPRLVRAARAGRLPQIGDGRNRVDLTYVANVVHAIALALDAPRAFGGTYTITNDEHVELWPVIRRVLAHCGLDTRLRRIPIALALGLGHTLELSARISGGEPLLTRYTAAILGRHQTYDITAARRDLGYEPIVPFERGLEASLAALQGADETGAGV